MFVFLSLLYFLQFSSFIQSQAYINFLCFVFLLFLINQLFFNVMLMDIYDGYVDWFFSFFIVSKIAYHHILYMRRFLIYVSSWISFLFPLYKNVFSFFFYYRLLFNKIREYVHFSEIMIYTNLVKDCYSIYSRSKLNSIVPVFPLLI